MTFSGRGNQEEVVVTASKRGTDDKFCVADCRRSG